MLFATPPTASTVMCCLWGQMRLIRLGIWCCYNKWSVLELCATRHFCASLVAAVLATLYPCTATFLFSLATTAYSDWRIAPRELDNGGTLEAFNAVHLLVGQIGALWLGVPADAGLSASAPYIRAQFGWLYLFAAFSKLNRDFLDPRRSSNTFFFVAILGGFGVPAETLSDDGWLRLLRVGLLGLETVEWAIPLLLMSQCVRLGLALDWGFHLALGLVAFDFSSAAMATLPLWLPAESLVAHLSFCTFAPAARAGWAVALVALGRWLPPGGFGEASFTPVHLLWLVWSCLLASGLLSGCLAATDVELPGWSAFGEAMTPVEETALLPPAVALLCGSMLSLFVLGGLSPYLGLKTHSTYSMFSNLRVEGGKTNHLLYRPWMAPLPFLADLVTIRATDLPSVRKYVRKVAGPLVAGSLEALAKRLQLDVCVWSNSTNGGGGDGLEGDGVHWVVFPYRLPFVQLRALVAEATEDDFFVEYARSDGVVQRFELKGGSVVSGDVRLRRRLPTAALRKWLFCRAIHVDEKECGVCQH